MPAQSHSVIEWNLIKIIKYDLNLNPDVIKSEFSHSFIKQLAILCFTGVMLFYGNQKVQSTKYPAEQSFDGLSSRQSMPQHYHNFFLLSIMGYTGHTTLDVKCNNVNLIFTDGTERNLQNFDSIMIQLKIACIPPDLQWFWIMFVNCCILNNASVFHRRTSFYIFKIIYNCKIYFRILSHF